MEAALRAARAQPKTAHLDYEVVWAPFQLDETLPEAGEDKMTRYSQKFGAQRMVGMIDMMKKTGAALEPPIAFSYGGTVSNTISSHVVLEAALVEGGPALQDRVVDRFFSHCASGAARAHAALAAFLQALTLVRPSPFT